MTTLQTKAYDFLNEDECAQIVKKLHALQELWIHHKSAGPEVFTKTLGYPIYLDPNDGQKYHSSILKSQQLMLENFSELYDRVCGFFATFLHEPVRLAPNGAVPGFHIFDRPMPTGGLVHFDRHHEMFSRFFKDDWDLASYLSFTLPLKVPQNGAGLSLWNVTMKDLAVDGAQIKLKEQKPNIIPYLPGKIFVLTEQLLHKMAPDNGYVEGDERITLQGHLIRHQNGGWVLYW